MKQSKTLAITGMLSFLAGIIVWILLSMVFTGAEKFAIPAAAILAAIGTFLMILNAVINPGSIPRPEVKIPEINLPPEVSAYHNTKIDHTIPKVNTGIINVKEWPVVWMFSGSGGRLTIRQQIRGTLCFLVWTAATAGYFLLSHYFGQNDITWMVFLGALIIHISIYGLFSIKGESESVENNA